MSIEMNSNNNSTEAHFTNQSLALGWFIVALGAVYYCYEYFLRISPSVMTADLMRAYHLTGAQVGSLSAFYYHAYVPMQIIVGLLMDRYGPRRLLTIACLLCAVGTYFFASSHNLVVAQAGRFLVGFGSAFAFVGAAKLATLWLPPSRFALVSGIIVCLGMFGAMLGDIALRLLVDAIGWRTTSFLAGGVGIILAIVLWTVIRDVNPILPDHYAHHDTSFKKVFIGLWQVIMNTQIWLVGLVGFLLYLSLSAFAELWGIPYLEQAHGFTKMQAAFANSLVFLGWALGSPFWGWYSDHLRYRCLPIRVAAIGTLITICMLLYLPHLSVFWICLLLFLIGLLSSAQVLVFALNREAMSIKIAGTVIAFTNLVVMIGGNIFQPVIGKLLDVKWHGGMIDGARVYSPAAYEYALSVLPICTLIAVVILFFIRETYCKIKIDE